MPSPRAHNEAPLIEPPKTCRRLGPIMRPPELAPMGSHVNTGHRPMLPLMVTGHIHGVTCQHPLFTVKIARISIFLYMARKLKWIMR